MKLYCPFSNGTAATIWDAQNCCHCRRRACAAKRRLYRCQNLTPHCVAIVGATTSEQKNGRFCAMPTRCASFTSVPASRRRDPGKNTPGLFGNGGAPL